MPTRPLPPSSAARPDHPGRLVALDQVKSVTVDSKDVLVNGETFARADSVASARQLAQFLDGLAKRPMAERAGAIEADIEASFDTSRIEARLVEFDQAVSTLRLVCTCQFFLLFLALPWIIYRDLFGVYWLHLLAGLAIGVAVIAVLYARVHRRLYPDDRGDRWAGLAMMLLVPPAAVRACDALARNLVAGFDVLAVARVACDPAAFSRLAGRLLRDLTRPALPVCPSDDPEKAATEARHREGLLRHYVRFLEEAGESIDRLLGPPEPDDGAISYCPRCHEQFVLPGGECRNCGGIPLVGLPRRRLARSPGHRADEGRERLSTTPRRDGPEFHREARLPRSPTRREAHPRPQVFALSPDELQAQITQSTHPDQYHAESAVLFRDSAEDSFSWSHRDLGREFPDSPDRCV